MWLDRERTIRSSPRHGLSLLNRYAVSLIMFFLILEGTAQCTPSLLGFRGLNVLLHSPLLIILSVLLHGFFGPLLHGGGGQQDFRVSPLDLIGLIWTGLGVFGSKGLGLGLDNIYSKLKKWFLLCRDFITSLKPSQAYHSMIISYWL